MEGYHGGSLRYRQYGHQTHVKGRGEGASVAIFVTFKDKLGHPVDAATVLFVVIYPLTCEIKVLERLHTWELLAPKMQLC